VTCVYFYMTRVIFENYTVEKNESTVLNPKDACSALSFMEFRQASIPKDTISLKLSKPLAIMFFSARLHF
jgi:hypothetical protein